MKHPAVAIDLHPIVQPLHDSCMIVLDTEILPVGEPVLDADPRLLIVGSAPSSCSHKRRDFLAALKGVTDWHEGEGTVFGEQGAKALIGVGRDDIQVGLNELLLILAQHSFSDLCISSPFQHLVLARAQRLPERGVDQHDAASPLASVQGGAWRMITNIPLLMR